MLYLFFKTFYKKIDKIVKLFKILIKNILKDNILLCVLVSHVSPFRSFNFVAEAVNVFYNKWLRKQSRALRLQ